MVFYKLKKKNNIKKFKLDNNKEYIEEIIDFYRLIFEKKGKSKSN